MEQKRKNRKVWGLCAGALALLLLLAGLWMALHYTADTEPQMEATPANMFTNSIVVAADIDYQPYSFYSTNGKPAGYDVELMYLLANSMGKNVELRLMPWPEAQQAVHSGEADVLLGLDYNLQNLQNYELSMPLDNDPFVAFGKQTFTGVDDLYDKRLATSEGSGSFTSFITPYQLEHQTQTYPTYSEAFAALERGECDYVFAMYSVGRRAVANLGDTKIQAVGPTLADNNLCIGTQKGNTALRDELNGAIIQLKRDGALDKLGEKWLGRYVEVISPREYALQNWMVLVLLLALVLLGVALAYGLVGRQLAKSARLQQQMTKRLLDYQQVVSDATKGLYENICEVNITQNCLEGESTQQYFESMGVPRGTPFDEGLRIIADTQLDAAYVKNYLDTLCTKNVTQAFLQGKDRLSCEFLVRDKNGSPCWMGVYARLIHWKEDDTLRMITYRVNIDEDKKKEQFLAEKARVDSLTGLYNKAATEELIRTALAVKEQAPQAFLMLDIDNFKTVNDNFGHAFGDLAITEFAAVLKHSVETTPGTVLGRIGGDEFAAFLPYQSPAQLEDFAAQLVRSLSREISIDGKPAHISASLGIALYPAHGTSFEQLYRQADAALYQTKKNGKNGYTFYTEELLNNSCELKMDSGK